MPVISPVHDTVHYSKVGATSENKSKYQDLLYDFRG